MYSKKTINELKQILDDHNCAIPNGAKKKDLVELVEAIMAKDEDFVTMQVENPDDMFDELFDNTEEEAKEVVVEESVGEEGRPPGCSHCCRSRGRGSSGSLSPSPGS